jgi:hypothetical protein
MATKTTLNVQLGTGFWLLIGAILLGLVLWKVLGTDRLASTIRAGWRDAVGK